MADRRVKISLETIALAAIIVFGVILENATGQNCGCTDNECCSQYGDCGYGNDYCGWPGCQEGPCDSPPTPIHNSTDVVSVVTDAFYEAMMSQTSNSCAGWEFYARNNFVEAALREPYFCTLSTNMTREIAAFFALVGESTTRFCDVATSKEDDYCDPLFTPTYPCYPNEKYYGRGPLQLTWNYNYGPAGKYLELDLLKNPDILQEDPVVSFQASMWFWIYRVHNEFEKGFGYAVRAVKPGICDGSNPEALQEAVNLFKLYCYRFGTYQGENLYC